VVVGEVLIINDSRSVHTVNIHTGQAEEIYPRGIKLPQAEIAKTPRLGSPCFTMTARKQLLFARMGSPVTTYLSNGGIAAEPGYLLGWDLETKKLVLDLLAPDGPLWGLDGTPLADDSNLHVAMRYTDINPQAYVACYDLQGQRLQWRTKVCSADTVARGLAEELTHDLLTLDHGAIYFNTNLGAVCALSADDGRPRWITRYPRRSAPAVGQADQRDRAHRSIAPCLFHRGMLLVAPIDSNRVFALDATSGQLIWQTTLNDGQPDSVHLLGVAGQHLIACGRRLWWLDIATGQLSRDIVQNPYQGAHDVPLRGLGRGVVAGNQIYWPAQGTSPAIHVIDHRTGRATRNPIPFDTADTTGVNLIAARGYLFLTASSKIYAFRGSSAWDQ
jgi:outer membrane protein assembly factor BamB